MTDIRPAPRPPDLQRRTLTPVGYAVCVIVPVLIAAIGLTILHFGYDPEDLVKGEQVPLLTSDWRPGDGGDDAQIAGVLTLGKDGCARLVTADGQELTPVWPADYEATVDNKVLKLYDPDRTIVARGGDAIRMGGGYADLGEYAGRPCAPSPGTEVALVQSDVTVTARAA